MTTFEVEVGLIALANVLGAFPPSTMIVLGAVLLLLGYLLGVSILVGIGWLLVLIGLVLWALAAAGNPAGRRWY